MSSQIAPSDNRMAMEGFSKQKDITDLNRLKMAELNAQMDQSSIGNTQNFKGALNRAQASNPGQSPWDFSGGQASELQEYSLQKEMQGMNKGAFSQLLSAKDLDKEMNFLTELIVEDFKNPDPTKERDSTQQTMAMLTMMSAGSQMQVASNVHQLNKQTEQQTQLILESRIGKKVQYRDKFLELTPGLAETPIRYRLAKDAGSGILRIYDAEGRTVEERALTGLEKGDHQFNWARTIQGSKNLAKDGIYFVELDMKDRNGKSLEDTDHVFELEGTISGIEKNKSGMPIYYVGGQPVQGALTRVSKAGEFQQFSGVEEKLGTLHELLQNSRPIQPSPLQKKIAAMEAESLRRNIRNNPYIDAVA